MINKCDIWLGSLLWLGRRGLGWVTIFGRTNHLSISPSHPGQLSLLPSASRKISTSESAVTLCGWGLLIPLINKRVGGR